MSKKEFDILILLGNEINQNIKLLKFIEYSIRNLDLKVLVRMHPSSRAIKILHNFFKKFSFIKNSTNSVLSNDVELAKIIVYGDTGASIDCLNFHVPLCYINDDNCLLSDRINELITGHFRFYEFNDFKLALPKLLVANNHFSFDTIKNNYISPLLPNSFSFE
jgi:hypothetical protein